MKEINISNKKVQIEGMYSVYFMKKCIEEFGLSLKDKNILEIGPKHGLHTLFIDSFNPKQIDCVDLENKKEIHKTWDFKIKSHMNMYIQDLFHFKSDIKYDLILFNGVIYHLLEQYRSLCLLNDFLSDEGFLFYETATARKEENRDKNIIEVYYPQKYRDISTITFLPTKQAHLSLLSMAKFETLGTDKESKTDRLSAICKKAHEIPLTSVG
jgi:hypothetical protein